MEKTIIASTGPMQYRDLGSGEPVLLLHGFGEDAHIWDKILPDLTPHARWLVPQLPGTGGSTVSEWTDANTSLDAMADALLQVLDAEGLDKATVLGHSMGGYITLSLAERHPHRLRAFGLLHSTAYADSDAKKETREKAIAFIREHGGHAFLQTAIPGLFAEGFRESGADKVASLIESGRSLPDDTLVAYYRAMIARPDRTQALRDARVPVLFVLGTDDKAAPLEDVLKQVSLPAVAHVHILPDTGHMGMWERSGEFAQFLLKFIREV